jgi:molybdopterin-guanine dinucleotide biosynthesis protein B
MNVFGIAGYSGSGKTTLLEKLLPRFTALGLRISVIKHAHHNFDVDKPGKDSYRHRAAGASEVLLASSARWALMNELRGAPEPTLEACLSRLSPCDLVLVEGVKHDAIPKLEIYRPANGKPPLWPDNPHIVGIATDAVLNEPPAHLPVLDLNDAEAIVRFILTTLKINGKPLPSVQV